MDNSNAHNCNHNHRNDKLIDQPPPAKRPKIRKQYSLSIRVNVQYDQIYKG